MRFPRCLPALVLAHLGAGCVFNAAGLPPLDQREDTAGDRRVEARRDAPAEQGADRAADSAPPDRLAPPDRAVVEAPVACSGSSTCPGTLVCKAGFCVSPWGIKYNITLQSAVIACPKPGGGNWNATPNDPNPLLKVEVDGQSSSYAQKTADCHPTWSSANKQYVIDAPSTVAFRVFNVKSGTDELLGGLTFSGLIAVDAKLNSLENLLKAEGFTSLYVSAQVTALTISMVPAP
jgi:hypothetical protein